MQLLTRNSHDVCIIDLLLAGDKMLNMIFGLSHSNGDRCLHVFVFNLEADLRDKALHVERCKNDVLCRDLHNSVSIAGLENCDGKGPAAPRKRVAGDSCLYSIAEAA